VVKFHWHTQLDYEAGREVQQAKREGTFDATVEDQRLGHYRLLVHFPLFGKVAGYRCYLDEESHQMRLMSGQ